MESSTESGLDHLLERELKQKAAAHQGVSPLPEAARYHAAFLSGGAQMSFLPQFAAGLSAKAAIGLTVAAVSVGGGTAAAIATGSANPVNWGQAVVQAVTTCKAEYGPSATPSSSATAKQNVGQCVSAFAKQHGQQERVLHAKGGPSGLPTSHPTGKPSGLPTNHPTGKPSGLPTNHPTGKPRGLPTGH
ncbi:MAG TPA: PT domain-containing protein [Candidatus Micrarchaeaceae archaeon]|nr:PT domain-containing protein [Candidatus Micrarchaeaceae archaeon]